MQEVENVKITHVDLSMADCGCLVLELTLEGKGWGCVYGNRCLGHGYLGADNFEGAPKGIEEIMRIMDVVGVDHFNDMLGKYVRVEAGGWGDKITKIGNIVEDKWFDYKEFYGS